MKTLYHIYIVCLLALLCATTATAQEANRTAAPQGGVGDDMTRFVTRTTSVGVGVASLQDTYLSPEEYNGVELRLHHESERLTRLMGGRVLRHVELYGSYAGTRNRADNNSTMAGMVGWNYALLYQLPLKHALELRVGPVGSLATGFVYNMRNGNNPAALRAQGSVGAMGVLCWNTRLWGKGLALRYEASAPLLGLAFMPHYGQSYYEIFGLGHGNGVVHVTTPVSMPSLWHAASADMALSRHLTLRVGLHSDLRQLSLGGIKTHQYSHLLMVGVVKRLYKL